MAQDEPTFQECRDIEGVRYCRDIDPVATDATQATEIAQTETQSDLFAWADPIRADPIGWLEANVLQWDILLPVANQITVVLAVLIGGMVIAPTIRRLVVTGIGRLPKELGERIDETLPRMVRPVLWAGGLSIAQASLAAAGMESTLVRIAASLSLANVLITLVSRFLPEAMRAILSRIIWLFAIFYALGIHDDILEWLSNVGPFFGGRQISPTFIAQAVLTAGLFLFAANWLSKRLKQRVEELPKVEPSLRILISNALQIGLFLAAAILTLAGLGIPLSGLAVLGGAVGVGLGFGMQQIVANFISGVILLTDRSIKPDDVIEVDETYGVVKSLGLRYASVVTRDGKEHLIPNELLITDKVVNWSFSNRNVRIKARIRVEYETDLRQAVGLVVDGCAAIERVLSEPAPKCLVMEFGDEAIELEARFWINDPQNGVSNVSSAVKLAIWDRFQEHGIDIPLRHEDVLITPGSTLKVEMVRAGAQAQKAKTDIRKD